MAAARNVYLCFATGIWMALILAGLASRAMAQTGAVPQSGSTPTDQNAAAVPSTPPPFDPRRYVEDYRCLDDPAQRTGAWWEPPKHVRLGSTEDVFLRLGGEVRIRNENYQANLFSRSPAADQSYIWERVLPYADLHAGHDLRFFLQFEAAYAQGEKPGPKPFDQTRADFLQGFVEYSRETTWGRFSGRAGRQVLTYGDGSLIDSRYGPNVLQSFDGTFLNWLHGYWHSDVFWARPVVNGLGNFDDTSSSGQQIWGWIAGHDLPRLKKGVLDVYYFGFHNKAAMFNQLRGRERRESFGLRHVGGFRDIDWKGELIGQTGSFGSGSIRAGAAAGEVGYTFAKTATKPRPHLNGGVASGDRNAKHRNIQTFNALFPRGQYFSDTGLIGPYNLINIREGVQLQLHATLTLDVLAGEYWRQSTSDAVYRNEGAVLFPADAGRGRYVATQYEAVADFQPRRSLAFRLTVAHFAPGTFVNTISSVAPLWFLGAETRFWF